jgi:hypothetical protein
MFLAGKNNPFGKSQKTTKSLIRPASKILPEVPETLPLPIESNYFFIIIFIIKNYKKTYEGSYSKSFRGKRDN